MPPGRTATCRVTACAHFLPTMHRGLYITVISHTFQDIPQLLQWQPMPPLRTLAIIRTLLQKPPIVEGVQKKDTQSSYYQASK